MSSVQYINNWDFKIFSLQMGNEVTEAPEVWGLQQGVRSLSKRSKGEAPDGTDTAKRWLRSQPSGMATFTCSRSSARGAGYRDRHWLILPLLNPRRAKRHQCWRSFVLFCFHAMGSITPFFLIWLAIKTDRFSPGAATNIAWAGFPVWNGRHKQHSHGQTWIQRRW